MAVAATAVKSSTAETLSPFPVAIAAKGGMLMLAAVTTPAEFVVKVTGLVMLRRPRQPSMPWLSEAE